MGQARTLRHPLHASHRSSICWRHGLPCGGPGGCGVGDGRCTSGTRVCALELVVLLHYTSMCLSGPGQFVLLPSNGWVGSGGGSGGVLGRACMWRAARGTFVFVLQLSCQSSNLI